MWPFSSQVLKKLRVGTARVGEGIGEDAETGRVEFTTGKEVVVVCGLGEGPDEAIVPGEQGRLDGRERFEGVAEKVAE